MRILGFAAAAALIVIGGLSLRPDPNPQQQALIGLAEAGGYEVDVLPGYNGAWWMTVRVPGCKNPVGLRSEEAPQSHVPTTYVVVRIGSAPREVVGPSLPADVSATSLRGFGPAWSHLDC